MKRYRLVLLLIVISLSMILFSEKGIQKIKQHFNQTREERGSSAEEILPQIEKLNFTVVLDPGHGGYDPGKVGVNGAIEKDINLSISNKLKNLLEQKGTEVIMTRTADEALCNNVNKYNKSDDMKNRVKLIEDTAPDIAISIHQNSFTSSSSKGAQVFFYKGSENSQRLAETLQETIKELLADGNTRSAKANDTYYLLKKTTCPIVIVECGFLTNPIEADLLNSEDYQNKAAEAICEGIMRYYYNAIKK